MIIIFVCVYSDEHACCTIIQVYNMCVCRYVASQMKKAIERVGPEKVLLVVIDGGSQN